MFNTSSAAQVAVRNSAGTGYAVARFTLQEWDGTVRAAADQSFIDSATPEKAENFQLETFNPHVVDTHFHWYLVAILSKMIVPFNFTQSINISTALEAKKQKSKQHTCNVCSRTSDKRTLYSSPLGSRKWLAYRTSCT